MNYYQLKLPIRESQEQNDILMAQLSALGYESFEETETLLLAYIQENDFSKETLAEIPVCKELSEKDKLNIEFIKEQNWNAVWESNYPPVLIENKCYIHAPFHEKRSDVDFNILINPKMAFGTAHHETTSQIIKLLLEEDLSGKEILDMGCGTGVLAILASMKGAFHIDAVDNDPWAFNNTEENVEQNNIKNIKALLGDASLLTQSEKYDIIFANINKNILLQDIPTYSKALKPKGDIYFSGFYEVDLEQIKSKALENSLHYIKHISKNNWVAAVFRKV
ncbi:MAG: 50S ribosomal protein L11 methyltransferase [Bacteroidales bacterium]|nr:50S ribosomal protein L11 methyltransferase [Bacteroidales bacterium]